MRAAILAMLLWSCAEDPGVEPAVTTLANTVAGHADIQVATSAPGDLEDQWGSVAAPLQSGRFVVAWLDGSGYLKFRRYDVPGGGWVSAETVLDWYDFNVRSAGSVSATEGGITQAVAWLVWDYHPNSSTWTINWSRVRNDGTHHDAIDVRTAAAAAAGATGQTSGFPALPRVVVVWVEGSIWDGGGLYMACGTRLRAMIYDELGNVIVGPFDVDGPSTNHCFAAPSVAWSNYDPRFHIVYQYRGIEPDPDLDVWWRHKYVTATGTVQGTPDTLWRCAGGLKDGDTVLTGRECHRHTLAFDASSSRNATHVFAWAYYGLLQIYDQSWAMVREENVGGGSTVVARALSPVNYSYQATCTSPTCTAFANPKFYDDIAGRYDSDTIGSRPCTLGGNRGGCYVGEALAISGSYAMALYREWTVTPKPLFLSILDAN